MKDLYDTALLNTARSPRDMLAYKRTLWLQQEGDKEKEKPSRRELLSLLQESLLSFHSRHWTGSFNLLVLRNEEQKRNQQQTSAVLRLTSNQAEETSSGPARLFDDLKVLKIEGDSERTPK